MLAAAAGSGRANGEATSASRRARFARPTALAIAAAVNLALLSLMAQPGRYLLPTRPETGPRPVDVSVVVLRRARTPPPRSGSRRGAPSPEHAPQRQPAGPPILAPSPAAPAPGEGPPAFPNSAEVAAALRHGPSGCANQGAAWMSQADKDACRQRLAVGAASVPHLEGMAPNKLAYYAAVAQAEDDWRTGRNPGHLPFLACMPGGKPPPHALKIGPCFIDPPVGSLDQDADVPPP